MVAGRDLKEGGTWLGVTRTGCSPRSPTTATWPGRLPNAPSRGRLVSDYLRSEETGSRLP
ncbi:MAG: NRDE family protein [Chromatiales bacterium]|nr:NRDE family protein [Chromatiales bacterium]